MNTVVDEPVRLELLAAEPQTDRPLVAQQAQPMTTQQPSVVEYAMRNGASAAEVTALVQLQIQMDNHKREMRKLDDEREREQRQEARVNAYNAAFAAFKRNPPDIYKDKHVYFQNKAGVETSYDHATIGEVCDKVVAALATHDISHRWVPGVAENGRLTMTCVLRHTLGHEERTTLEGPPDESGGKNSLQARQSTYTYLERHSLLMACGLATKAMPDDDGRGAGEGRGTAADDSDPVLTAFTAAALKGEKALRAHYEANVPTEEFWTSKGAYLRKIAKGVDQQAAQVAA